MDKWQAIQTFWEGFNIPAYDVATVPSGVNSPQFPYITYEVRTGAIGDTVALSASIWDRSDSWERISKLADSIAEDIGKYGHVVAKIDTGYVYITQGAPFAQRVADEDDSIRRILLNVNVEFLTAY